MPRCSPVVDHSPVVEMPLPDQAPANAPRIAVLDVDGLLLNSNTTGLYSQGDNVDAGHHVTAARPPDSPIFQRANFFWLAMSAPILILHSEYGRVNRPRHSHPFGLPLIACCLSSHRRRRSLRCVFAISKTCFPPLGPKQSARRRPSCQVRPRFEALEDRQMLSTVWVDSNPADARAHHGDFSTISAAVAAAHSRDTIMVAPGQYNESVTVNKSLTIIGGQPRMAGETGASVVNPSNATSSVGFTLAANDVTVQNFTISPNALTGIATRPSYSGYNVLNCNLAGVAQFGMDLETSASSTAHPSTVSGNQFGGTTATSIFSAGSSNLTVSNNTVTGQGNAIEYFTFRNATNLQVLGNHLNYTQGIQLWNVSNAKVDNNVVSNSRSINAIDLTGTVTGTEIANNTLTPSISSAATAGIGTEFSYADTISNDQIRNNSITGFGEGIFLAGQGAAQNSVVNDVISQNTISGCILNAIFLWCRIPVKTVPVATRSPPIRARTTGITALPYPARPTSRSTATHWMAMWPTASGWQTRRITRFLAIRPTGTRNTASISRERDRITFRPIVQQQRPSRHPARRERRRQYLQRQHGPG